MISSQTSPPNLTGAKQLGLPDIAFVGKAGAGKSTGAELLAQLGYRCLSFAAPLKNVAAQLWGEDARTDREKLQRLGVAVRQIEPDTWVNLLTGFYRDPYGDMRGTAIPHVCDDLRFENEWYALIGAGFVIIRVTAPLALRIDRLKASGKWQDDAQLEHESETAVDHLEADYTIENGSDRDTFYDELVDIVIRERKRR